jgi:polysaccharide deacetylase family protein (PEP-CTERM system associated)
MIIQPNDPADPTTQQTQRPDDWPRIILITVDLEDWFQVENLRPVFPQSSWDMCESRIERNTRPLLDLFDKHRVRTTFFVLGLIAERFPGLVREVQFRGHEIASHGHSHRLCTELPKEAVHNDLKRSKALLEDTIGRQVLGYRAPSFSITSELVEVLNDVGHQYDSSYNSFDFNRRYGKINGQFCALGRHCLEADNGIVEIPLSNLKLGGRNLSWSGGGFFRFWPTPVFEAGVSRILRDKGMYVLYCHPWEIDPAQPRVSGIGRVNSFRHYCNLDKTLGRLDHFISRFRHCNFMTCTTYVESIRSARLFYPSGP